MMNRTAETLFWTGRYLERVESHTSFIDVNYHMRHVLLNHQDECKWERLIASISDIHLFKEHFEQANETTALQFLTFEKYNQNSIFSCVSYIRNNIRTLRQLLPSELWDSINGFYLWLKEQDISKLMMQSPHIFYQRIKEWIYLFNGVAESTMVRNQVWYFIQAGKFFERAENSMRILHRFYVNFINDYPYNNQDNYQRLMILLKSASGYEAFRKLYANQVTFAKVIEFLISHPTFPHSVRYSLSSMEQCLMKIKQQDYPFNIIAGEAIDFVEIIKANLSNLHEHEQDYSVELHLFHEMLESINRLGLEVSETFFQGEIVEA